MQYANFKEFKKAKGTTFPPTAWFEVTQKMIDHFSKATHDTQWIHVDPERAAKEMPHKKTIAHGFLSLGLIPKCIAESVQVQSLKMGVNSGLEAVKFPHPVLVGSMVRGQVTLTEIEDQKFGAIKVIWDIRIEIQNIKKPACIARMTTIAYE